MCFVGCNFEQAIKDIALTTLSLVRHSPVLDPVLKVADAAIASYVRIASS